MSPPSPSIGAARSAGRRAQHIAERRAAFAAGSLDFEEILPLLERFTSSSLGMRMVRELHPLAPEEARLALARVREAIELGRNKDRPPLGGVSDPEQFLGDALTGGRSIGAEGFGALRSFLEASERLTAWADVRKVEAPELYALARTIPNQRALLERLDQVVDERGEVRDEASPRVANLRVEIRTRSRQIEEALKQLLSQSQIRNSLTDARVHLRGGRMVLAVKAKSAGRVRGMVHDRSQSEQTAFIEPREVIEPQNRLAEAKGDLDREIQRLLLELTREVLEAWPALDAAATAVGRMELATVGEGFAAAWGARVPDLADPDAPGLLLRAARHPLLLEEQHLGHLEEVVPLDLRLGSEFDMLIITGPNTGGKTLALKTAGLAALVVACGLPFPCERGSRVPLYAGVVADIGDEQEIAQSLSTFSSHIARIRAGLERAAPDVLFLLDELGGGTDPDEGAALGEALLEHLLGLGAPTLVSTHLGRLKEFAFRHGRAENGCTEFDLATLAPRYKLIVGRAGESGALAIARRLGLEPELLERASDLLVRREGEVEELLRDVGRARAKAEEARALAEQELVELEERSGAMAAERARVAERSEQLEAEAQRGIEERVRDARRILAGLQPSLSQVPQPLRGQLVGDLDRIDAELAGATLTTRRKEFLASLAKGQWVYVPRYRQRCVVQRVVADKEEVTVKLGGMKMKVSFDEVTWYESL